VERGTGGDEEGGDNLGFVSMMIAFMAIILLVLGILFVVGLIFLGIGIVTKKNPKNKGRKYPIVFIVVGVLLLLPVTVSVVGVSMTALIKSTKTAIKQTQYECVPDKWRNERVQDHAAAQEVLDALLKAADDGDKEAFAKNFTPEIQERTDFEDTLDLFFASYPEGFSGCNIEVGPVGGGGSYNYGHNVLNARTSIDVVMNGEWYTIRLDFCYENTDHPEKVGVTDFTIRNLDGAAYFRDQSNKEPEYFEEEYLICSIMSDQEISARLINGMPFLWTDTPEPKLTEDEMRELLTEYRDEGIGIPEVYDVIGEPNAYIKLSNSTGYDYYYELAQEDGVPRYVHICTSTARGRIIRAYLCDSEKQYYDEPIVEYIKPQ